MSPAPDSWCANARARPRARHRLKSGGGAGEIVTLVGVVLVAVVVVVLGVLVVDVVLLLLLVVAISVQQLGAPRGRVALELAQPENVHAVFLALVAGAEQEYPVLLDHVQLLDLHRLVEDQSVRESVWKLESDRY